MFEISNIQARPTPTLFEKRGGKFTLFQRFAKTSIAFLSSSLSSVVVALGTYPGGSLKAALAFASSALAVVVVAVAAGARSAKASIAFSTSALALVVKPVAGPADSIKSSSEFLSSVLLVVTRNIAPADPILATTSTAFLSSSLA